MAKRYEDLHILNLCITALCDVYKVFNFPMNKIKSGLSHKNSPDRHNPLTVPKADYPISIAQKIALVNHCYIAASR